MKKNNLKATEKIIPLDDYCESHITLNRVSCDGKILKKYLSDLEKRGWKIVRIVGFGDGEKLKKISKSVEIYPYLALGHSNSSGKETKKCGFEIFSVRGDFRQFEYIKLNRRTAGTFFKTRNREYLVVGGLGRQKKDKKTGFKQEAKEIYVSVDKILSQYNFSCRNIYRFWNAMENMLKKNARNYALFNEARDEYFKGHEITKYPAATGIEASLPGGQRIVIGFEAVKSKKRGDVPFRTLNSDFQCEAWEYEKYKAAKYSPKFSRAALLRFEKEGMKKIYVSGTSNVDRRGRSVLLDDYEKNINYVVSCVEHLLKKSEASLRDIIMARLYFKNNELQKVFQDIYKKRNWKFQYNFLLANICRDNFFFEMDCVVAKSES